MRQQLYHFIVLWGVLAFSQRQDSVSTQSIECINIIKTGVSLKRERKPLGYIEAFLEQSSSIKMLRRGAYAWEPLLNGMPSERTTQTIEGMRIFGACTDKMDPITAYVEISNLESADIASGQQGNAFGHTIGGNINLKRKRIKFGEREWNFNLNTGIESINWQNILGGGVSFRNEKYYADIQLMNRNAENYKDGSGREVLYSQFQKLNLSGSYGYKLNERHTVEASVIYDLATDVGYPALPMDVARAEAVIASVEHRFQSDNYWAKRWHTKWYFNTINHQMDDSTRPNVPIRMDMPGRSRTVGYYSHLYSETENHRWKFNLNGFYNNAYAEMTMYPDNPNEPLMFMLTWADIGTLNQGISLHDDWHLTSASSIKLGASFAIQKDIIGNETGLNSLKIFHSEIDKSRLRFLKSVSANYTYHQHHWQTGIGIGYGDRAPSVSEGYGFYLFNSNELYDYIGNPNLKNESTVEANAYIAIKLPWFSAKLSGNFFHISDYVVGKITPFSAMTLGAKGVKQYTAIEYARIFNANLNAEFYLGEKWRLKSQVGYHYGKDSEGNHLPYISPFRYATTLSFEYHRWGAELGIQGNASKRNVASHYGEVPTDAYMLLNTSVGYSLPFFSKKLHLKLGVENLTNEYYTTYTDWKRIPRMGRNIFINLLFEF